MTTYLLLFLILAGVATPFIVQGLKRWSRAASIAALVLTALVSLVLAGIVTGLTVGHVFSLNLFLATCIVFAFATVTFKVLKDGLGVFTPPR